MQRLEASGEREDGGVEEDAPRSARLPSEGKNQVRKQNIDPRSRILFSRTLTKRLHSRLRMLRWEIAINM
jgi:hypothetical protein